MSQKVRKTLIMIVMTALIICLMAASLTYTFTYGRYAGGKFDNENSPYGDLIEFVGANQYIVRTPEELIQAIEDGYSNIKIADDAEEPFVIDTGVTDVSANLVLDVNGKTLIRNSRNPMLDVQTNVSVVLIYDSSDEEQGGFYNPVGSALQASGGTLTVGSGNYDDGPKKEEYNEYNGINSNHGTLGGSNPSVTLYARDNAPSGHPGLTTAFRATTKGYTHVEIDSLPTITPKIVEGETDDASDIVYGNIYLENGSTLNTNWLPADTFLLYTEEQGELVIGKLNGDGDVVLSGSDGYDDLSTPEQIFIKNGDEVEALSVACNVASCDFYYYYDTGEWIGADGKRQQGERPTTGFTPIYAVIYGYWDVMALARDDKENETDAEGMATALMDRGLVYPFAAVRMVEGEGFARGGQFSNNFGTVNSYGIYANGGALTASGANFTTGGDGVCIRCEGNADLDVSGGEFSSKIGNTIEMEGGTMNVTAGSFTKTDAKDIGSDGNDQIANQTAIIDIEDGTLKIEGKSANSVTLTAGGAVTNPGGTVTYSGTLENVFGIRAEGGTVTTSGCTFNISGDYSAGVLSYNGEINLGDDTSITVTQSETAKVLTSAGVSSEGGTIKLTGNVTIESDGLGITARGTVNVMGGDSTVEAKRGTGIYVNNGSFTVDSGAAITVNSTVKSDYSWATPPGNTATNTPNIYNGVYVQGGSLISNGTLNVNFTGVRNDAQAKSGTSFLENESIGDIEWIGQLGSYAIEVGTSESDLVRYQALIDATLQNNSQVYQTFTIKSFAVRIEQPQGEQSEVKIEAGKITNSVGGGVLVNGGTVTLGAEDEGEYNETTQRGLTIQTSGLETLDEDTYYVTGTGTYTTGYWPFRETHYCITFSQGYIPIEGTYRNWSYKQPSTGGDAVKVVDGTLNVLGGSYQAAQGNGILVSGATTTEDGDYAVEISGGTFVGNDSYNNIEGNAMPGAAASYGLKMYGGSLQVTGGTFGSTASRGSGAFVMGERNDSETSYATASILAGTFAAGGTAGLSVYYGANVYIGGDEAGASGTGIPTFQGNSAGMTVETYASDIGDSRITVYRGSFTGVTQDGIWYGGALTYLTIHRRNVTLSGPRDEVREDASPGRITYV